MLRLSTNSPETVHAPGAKGPRIVDTIISAMSFSKAHSQACSMADNVTDVFGSWLPLSGRTTKQEGQANKTGRQGSRPRPPQEQIGNVVTMLASLCLQQEDALNRIRLETSHTLHLAQQGQGAVLKALYNAGTAWQVKKNSGEPVQALRVVLFGLLLAETQARIQLFSKDDAAVKAAQTNHVLDKDKRFVYHKWDAQASKLVTDPDKKGLTLEEVMAILTELRKLSNDQTITKLNASRRLKKKPDNDDKAVFTVEVAMRSPPANRIQGLLDQMTDNAAWGLVAAQLAIAIQKALEADQTAPSNLVGVAQEVPHLSVLSLSLLLPHKECVISAIPATSTH